MHFFVLARVQIYLVNVTAQMHVLDVQLAIQLYSITAAIASLKDRKKFIVMGIYIDQFMLLSLQARKCIKTSAQAFSQVRFPVYQSNEESLLYIHVLILLYICIYTANTIGGIDHLSPSLCPHPSLHPVHVQLFHLLTNQGFLAINPS